MSALASSRPQTLYVAPLWVSEGTILVVGLPDHEDHTLEFGGNSISATSSVAGMVVFEHVRAEGPTPIRILAGGEEILQLVVQLPGGHGPVANIRDPGVGESSRSCANFGWSGERTVSGITVWGALAEECEFFGMNAYAQWRSPPNQATPENRYVGSRLDATYTNNNKVPLLFNGAVAGGDNLIRGTSWWFGVDCGLDNYGLGYVVNYVITEHATSVSSPAFLRLGPCLA